MFRLRFIIIVIIIIISSITIIVIIRLFVIIIIVISIMFMFLFMLCFFVVLFCIMLSVPDWPAPRVHSRRVRVSLVSGTMSQHTI